MVHNNPDIQTPTQLHTNKYRLQSKTNTLIIHV